MKPFAFLPLLLVLSCGGDSDSDGADAGASGNELSCVSDLGGVAFCAEYTGSSWTEAFVQSTVCSDSDQTFSAALCDQTGALFRCDTALGMPQEQKAYYFAGAMEGSSQAHCEGALMGTFVVL